MCFGALYARHCGHNEDLAPWVADRCPTAETTAQGFCGTLAPGTTTIMLPSCRACMSAEEKAREEAWADWQALWSEQCAVKTREWEAGCAARAERAEAQRKIEDVGVGGADGEEEVEGVRRRWREVVRRGAEEVVTLEAKMEGRRRAGVRKAR
ncbi:hypothetical protein Tdes44962_MAKER09720 [Teratosphaeria destructans]|uniref:Uncharacterized protein n=1 Tax=Teratosphaeria destructans TaxID=418781 RepID=A0A9W7SRF2_9PEZI|nr:hypothetical protein Tdes44962_MAKER09720 [Teratosphaeria destructans]